jgi:hypothetical protein
LAPLTEDVALIARQLKKKEEQPHAADREMNTPKFTIEKEMPYKRNTHRDVRDARKSYDLGRNQRYGAPPS